MEPIVKRPVGRPRKTPQVVEPPKPRGDLLRIAASRARAAAKPAKTYEYPVQPPKLMPGVVPAGATAPVLAMDANPYAFAAEAFPGGGFPGFSYLSQLATRAEYRAFASTLSTELTREWIEFTSKQDDDTDSADKIKAIEDEFKRLNIRGVFQRAAEHDCYFGRAQIFIEIDGADRSTPLILDPRTVKVGKLSRVSPVEAVWTTPAGYNALDPAAPDFYKPPKWFMLGQEVHASRLMTVVTRPLPDILKPAFNFAGMSLSQLAEPYVDNWLRTRQSVADLINNFSITAIATSMDQVLQGNDDGADLFARADFFTATRSNKGLMLLDKEREELVQVNTPLSGLHELQAQSQEHMCSVSRMPAIVLTGISPSGLNASSDGEIRIFYDWIAAQQEAFWREPLEVILKVVQLSLFGEIDPDIGIAFVPLYQMTPAEEAEIRAKDSATDCAYVDHQILDPSEVRDRLAKDPNSGYMGLDTSMELVPPLDDVPAEDKSVSEAQHRAMAAAASGHSTLGIPEKVGKEFIAKDAEFEENKHPRAANGQFGSGGGTSAKVEAGGVYSHLAKIDDAGGRSAVEKAASDLIANQPELENEVRREMSDLGYSMPQKQEKPGEVSRTQKQENDAPAGNVSQEFGEPDFVRAGAIEPPHEVRDKNKLADLVDKMKVSGWQGRPILTIDLGRGPEALTGSHRIQAAKLAGIEVPTIKIDPEIGNYEDENGKTIRDAMWLDADEIADYLDKAGESDAANLMRAEHAAQEKGYGK